MDREGNFLEDYLDFDSFAYYTAIQLISDNRDAYKTPRAGTILNLMEADMILTAIGGNDTYRLLP